MVGELAGKYAFSMAGYMGADIVHCHTLESPIANIPTVYTLHGPATEATVSKCAELSGNKNNYFTPISNRQKELYANISGNVNFTDTVYNCVDTKSVEWKKVKVYNCYEIMSIFSAISVWL